MKSIILAAGRGSRMGELTMDTPKGLLALNGKPLIEHQLKALKKNKINDITIITGYKKNSFDYLSLNKLHNKYWETTNMVYTLMLADKILAKEETIISYADIIYSHKLIGELLKSDSDFVLTYDPNWLDLWSKRFISPLEDAETFKIQDNLIKEIGSRADSLDEIQGQYMGLIKIKPNAWIQFKELYFSLSNDIQQKISITEMIAKLITLNSIEIKGLKNSYPWGEVDTASDLKLYNNNLIIT